ncbi:TOTE conflict system archaeo-eukaryotic primase domain-containing protein [Providencia sp. PROV019]|uniref:TOTE conflict system archaeo-eukaryotic primase domain-containing protein n=1 Tax=Providencia sp. PROV019 TaxID=2949754 RepID=UPI002349A525|nr:reverse transcriptase domain-containing protein [Providencia sp. PROV019]
MSDVSDLSILINGLFSTDQDFHAEQQSNGIYIKKAGKVLSDKIEYMLKNGGSIAVYQRNMNETVKWICYDFDILKSQLSLPNTEEAENELKSIVTKFCSYLKSKKINYLIEYSGNRGIHIWVTFVEKIPFKISYEITNLILDSAELNYNSDLIAIDLFPHSSKVTNSVGSCVKLPLSKHKKSNYYSYFLMEINEIDDFKKFNTLSNEFIGRQQSILQKHEPMSLDDIEKIFNVFFSRSDESLYDSRVKEIILSGMTLNEMLVHWDKSRVLKNLKSSIECGKLNNQERKLLVGLLINVYDKVGSNIGEKLLIEILKKQKNYNDIITNKAISSLSSFYFPSQEQIEGILQERFNEKLNKEELLNQIFTNLISYDQGYFDFCKTDIEVTRNAEMKYLIQNDEAQSRKVFNEMSNIKSDEYLKSINDFINNYNDKKINFYTHIRKEKNKDRSLISLECIERLTTSIILKQMYLFFELPVNNLTHGYRVNKGFKNGYIFEQWLYLWIKFLSNISSAITNEDYSEFYIIKTDISSFYSNINHDIMSRVLLESSPIHTIKNKVSSLDENSLERYKRLVSICLNISKKTIGSDIGLPQGPAYARFFAETYLFDIDSKFNEFLNNESIFLYQRYVDDIFIVCKNKSEAKKYFDYLNNELKLIGLKLNDDKTIIKQIKDFTPEYDEYRSQSKYSVDKVSNRYQSATDEEKSFAIDEFISLVSSDAKQDDYSFIFSHLKGVEEVEHFKNNEINNILVKGEGRGSLYRNLFVHILDDEKKWDYLINNEKFNSLQSEVLTSTIINYIEDGKVSHDKFLILMNELISKLTRTSLVEEHLFHISLLIGLDFDYTNISKNILINVLKVFPLRLEIEKVDSLLDYLNTEINSIKDKYDFVNLLYTISRVCNMTQSELTKLSSLFYSFISLNMNETEFEYKEDNINESLTFSVKFLYLVSLFSLSNENSSGELLKKMWQYCACLFNNLSDNEDLKIDYGWLHKISNIDINESKLYLLLSSIVDGELFRGVLDKKKIFETYHSLLLVFLSDKLTDLQRKNIKLILMEIKTNSVFYEWIIDRDFTKFHPRSKKWFENNIIYNNTIMLKKDNNVLIRKPYDLFLDNDGLAKSENGYCEVIEIYEASKLKNISNHLSKMGLKKFIHLLSTILSNSSETGFPNIFSSDPLIVDEKLLPFSKEIYRPNYFIYEDISGDVSAEKYSKNNFVKLMFSKYLDVNSRSSDIYNKYISLLPNNINIELFLKYLDMQLNELNELDDTNSTALIDLSVASAMYCCLSDEFSSFECLEEFIDFYIKNDRSKNHLHLFSIDKSLNVTDSSPVQLIETILSSIHITKTIVCPFLILNIDDDVKHYLNMINKIISKDDAFCPVLLSDFKKCHIKVNQVRRNVDLNGNVKYDFNNVRLINHVVESIDELSINNTHYLQTASHVYCGVSNGTLFLLSLPSSLSKIYEYIDNEYQLLSSQNAVSYIDYQYCDNSVDMQNLHGFEKAINVIQVHNAIDYDIAKETLIHWLKCFPKRFHEAFILLIAAHKTIQNKDRAIFCNAVLSLKNENKNLMMIKKVDDYNGTIRCLSEHEELMRVLNIFDPNFIDSDNDDLTIVADVIITGTQICKAMKYYVTGQGKDERYFDLEDKSEVKVSSRLSKIKTIYLCCIYYTEEAKEKIQTELKAILPNLVSVSIFSGVDISDYAFFGSSVEIGNSDKRKIIELLSNEDECKIIYSYINYPKIKNKEFRKYFLLDENKINKINLIARYKSLPKKSFPFLYLSIKTNEDLHPLSRIKEVSDFT